MKTEKEEAPEKLLLSEWTAEVEKTYKRAAIAESALNELYQIAGIKTLEALKEARHSHGENSFLKSLMLRDKKVRELSQFVPVENMIVPEPLKRAALLLEKEFDTSFIEFSSNEWETNFESLEAYCDKHLRTFASTRDQIEKVNFLKTICDYLNAIPMGQTTVPTFCGPLIDRDEKGFKPNSNFVLADPEKDFLN